MRLQKRLSRKVGKKEYVKWVITIPPSEVDTLHWRAGDRLVAEIDNDSLVIKKKPKKSKQLG